jgi:group II intron reverse transcriptase/maturase
VSLLPREETVRKLQETLQAKAKGAPGYRFYALYDKVYRADVLAEAYRRCRQNRGAAGVDGQTFEDIEHDGLEAWLGARAEELRKRTYQPQAVRRVWIPKAEGSQRPLGIPTVKDRVVQTAVLLVLEPIFETDLQPEQYAYRPERGAWDAIRQTMALIKAGHGEIVDADLSGYFDSIPHHELMTSVARRVSDRHLLRLLKMWLEAPVEEADERGRTRRTYRHRQEGKGIPQGAPLSPLLANLYMRRFVLGWKVLGHTARLQAQVVNYADDFVICCRGTAAQALTAMRAMMARLRLTVNDRKTRTCRVSEEPFRFLGYTIGRCYSPRTGESYVAPRPSPQAVRKLCRAIRERTGRAWLHLDPQDLVKSLLQRLRGWVNYFQLGQVSKAYRIVDQHVRYRLRKWLCAKYGIRGSGETRFPDRYLSEVLGVCTLEQLRHRLHEANA